MSGSNTSVFLISFSSTRIANDVTTNCHAASIRHIDKREEAPRIPVHVLDDIRGTYLWAFVFAHTKKRVQSYHDSPYTQSGVDVRIASRSRCHECTPHKALLHSFTPNPAGLATIRNRTSTFSKIRLYNGRGSNDKTWGRCDD